MTFRLALSEHDEKVIEKQSAAGRFVDASGVVRPVRMLEEMDTSP